MGLVVTVVAAAGDSGSPVVSKKVIKIHGTRRLARPGKRHTHTPRRTAAPHTEAALGTPRAALGAGFHSYPGRGAPTPAQAYSSLPKWYELFSASFWSCCRSCDEMAMRIPTPARAKTAAVSREP